MNFNVSAQRIVCADTHELVAGTVGRYQATFVLDPSWVGLAATAVFRAGRQGVQRKVLLGPELGCPVPWEVLREGGVRLSVGLYGVDEAGAVVIPTVWCDAGYISGGVPTNAAESQDPTPSIAQQMSAEFQSTRNAVAEDARTVTEAALHGPALGGNGNWHIWDLDKGAYVDTGVDSRGKSIYDVVIRTQAEFEALIASPTWLDAVSVCFVGDGGPLKFTRRDGLGCKIPQTVKQIQGMNSATIEVIDFNASAADNQAALWYETRPDTGDYWINALMVNCIGISTSQNDRIGSSVGFFNCTQLTHCTGTSCAADKCYAFYHCTKLTGCNGTADGNFAYGFYGCKYLIGCVGRADAQGNYCAQSAGFSTCTQLDNCNGTGMGENVYDGFYFCNKLTNCTGVAIGSWEGNGFTICTQLSNCDGTGDGIAGCYSFYNCNYLNGCKQGAVSPATDFLGGTNTKVDTATVVAG